MARIGRMVIGEDKILGKWQGKQIVPAAWLTDSLRGHIDMLDERAGSMATNSGSAILTRSALSARGVAALAMVDNGYF